MLQVYNENNVFYWIAGSGFWNDEGASARKKLKKPKEEKKEEKKEEIEEEIEEQEKKEEKKEEIEEKIEEQEKKEQSEETNKEVPHASQEVESDLVKEKTKKMCAYCQKKETLSKSLYCTKTCKTKATRQKK
jgi:hypothetical protein